MKHKSQKCLRLFAKLSGFLDGELSKTEAAAIRRHLADCRNCEVFLDTLRQTVELCRRMHTTKAAPGPLKAAARRQLLAAWRAAKITPPDATLRRARSPRPPDAR
jgi:anti-sigma factor (TIGR02949 family)